MKTQYGALIGVAMCLFIQAARAGDADLNITCEKKRVEEKPGTAAPRMD